jgi:hypothetical protein
MSNDALGQYVTFDQACARLGNSKWMLKRRVALEGIQVYVRSDDARVRLLRKADVDRLTTARAVSLTAPLEVAGTR